ncbi:MAG: MBL fold metallo-hydrolase [Halanaeroarchaeum sp.]
MTIASDWGEWLPRAVDDADPEGLAVWYLGCNGFVLKGASGTTVFVDPYLGTGDPPRTVRMIPVPFDPRDVASADAILATHEHTDHVHGPSQAPILAETDAAFFGPDAAIEVARDEEDWTRSYDVDEGDLVTVDEGDSFDVGEFVVHVEGAHDPDAAHPVSYVIEHAAGTFLHGGDTKPGAVLEDVGDRYDVDVAALAFGSDGAVPEKDTGEPSVTKWYSDENEVVEAARALRADALVPTHWDMWKGLTADPTALHDHVRSYEYPATLEIVEIGDRIDLD